MNHSSKLGFWLAEYYLSSQQSRDSGRYFEGGKRTFFETSEGPTTTYTENIPAPFKVHLITHIPHFPMIGLDSPVLKPLDANQSNRSPKSGASSPTKSSRPSSARSGSVSPLRRGPLRPSSPIRRAIQVQRDAPAFTIYAASEEEETQTLKTCQLMPKADMFDDEVPKENMVEGVVQAEGKDKDDSEKAAPKKSPSRLGRMPLGEHWPTLRTSKVTKPVTSPKRKPFTPLSALDFPAYISAGNNENVLLTSAKGLAVFDETFTYELPVFATPPRKRRMSIPAADTRTSISQPLVQTWQKTAFPVFQDE